MCDSAGVFEDPSIADLNHRIVQARTQLSQLEDVDNDVKLVRLRAAVPNHPFLLMRTVGFGGALSFLVMLVLSFAAPLAGPEGVRTMAALDEAMGLPVPLVMVALVGCLVVMGVVGQQLAVMRAQTAPLLPDERKIQQELLQKIVQMETRQEVNKRAPKKRNPLLES